MSGKIVLCTNCRKSLQKHLEFRYWFHTKNGHRICADGYGWASPPVEAELVY